MEGSRYDRGRRCAGRALSSVVCRARVRGRPAKTRGPQNRVLIPQMAKKDVCPGGSGIRANDGGLDRERGLGRSGPRRDRGQGLVADVAEDILHDDMPSGAPDLWARTRAVYRAPGRFARMGPKDYIRFDTRVLEDVCDGLPDDDRLDASGIAVTICGGAITLAGIVHSQLARHLVEAIAGRCRGVNHDRNNLRVSRSNNVYGR